MEEQNRVANILMSLIEAEITFTLCVLGSVCYVQKMKIFCLIFLKELEMPSESLTH